MSNEFAEIFGILRKQGETLAGIKATLEGMEKNQERDRIKVDDHDKRIGKVENKQHWYAGVSAAVSFLFTWFISHKSG